MRLNLEKKISYKIDSEEKRLLSPRKLFSLFEFNVPQTPKNIVYFHQEYMVLQNYIKKLLCLLTCVPRHITLNHDSE